MGTADPSYPLYPIAAAISAALLLSVFLSSFIRQSWNLSVAFLCFWVFFENLTLAINAIIWSNNADIRLCIYCDIVSHLQLIASVVKPMSTFLIMRRLYLIASLRSVELPSKATRRWDKFVEWTLGLIIPLVVAGPIYYTVQPMRFEVREGYGCVNVADNSIVSIVIMNVWLIIPPILSVAVYYPRVAKLLYRQSREFEHFLRSNQSISRTHYIRILALASINIFLILSLNLTIFILTVIFNIADYPGALPFYTGWSHLHTDWSPVGISWVHLEASGGKPIIAAQYLSQWTSVAHSFAIFALFGLTASARASYWGAICTVTGLFGWKPTWRGRVGVTRSVLSSIRFNRNAPPQEISLASCELGVLPSVIDVAPPPADAEVEGKQLAEGPVSEVDKSEGTIRQHSDEAEDVKRKPSELDTETIDVGEVSLTRRSSAMAV
ncbi:STE3-domain-containing protein [Peniophora sp. CONT]|nr:STE3-domain-containing protein [Peniophora sp. CONT]